MRNHVRNKGAGTLWIIFTVRAKCTFLWIIFTVRAKRTFAENQRENQRENGKIKVPLLGEVELRWGVVGGRVAGCF